MSNAWCLVLGIEPPNLEAVASHRAANPFALLLRREDGRGTGAAGAPALPARPAAGLSRRVEPEGLADAS